MTGRVEASTPKKPYSSLFFFFLFERDACRKQKRGEAEAKIEGGSCIKHWGETSFNRVTNARNISPYLYKYLAKNGKSANHWAAKHFRATGGHFHFPRRLTNIRYTLVVPAGFDPRSRTIAAKITAVDFFLFSVSPPRAPPRRGGKTIATKILIRMPDVNSAGAEQLDFRETAAANSTAPAP